jgi:hypothetical protein
MIEDSETEILITFFKFLLNFIILKLWTKFQESQTEILNTFFKISFIFYNFKIFKLSLKNPNRNPNYIF